MQKREREIGGGEQRLGPTVHGAAGLVHQTVALQDAVVVSGFPPGHVDRGGGELAEVDEARSRGR